MQSAAIPGVDLDLSKSDASNYFNQSAVDFSNSSVEFSANASQRETEGREKIKDLYLNVGSLVGTSLCAQ